MQSFSTRHFVICVASAMILLQGVVLTTAKDANAFPYCKPFSAEKLEAVVMPAFEACSDITEAVCLETCQLEKFGVIVNGKLTEDSWSQYLKRLYQPEVVQHHMKKYHSCTSLYKSGPKSKDCHENQKWFDCFEKAQSEMCPQSEGEGDGDGN